MVKLGLSLYPINGNILVDMLLWLVVLLLDSSHVVYVFCLVGILVEMSSV